jgi:outer membrane protein, multidrug efflux system
MIRKSVISLLASFLLAGCVAGPDYAGPPEVFSANRNDGFVRAGGNIIDTEPELAEWWLLLNDPELTRLIEAALSDNPSLQAAQARIAQARASVRQEKAGRFPTLGTQATAIQGRLPGLDIQNSAPPSASAPVSPQGQADDSLSVYNLGLNANWELDFAGGTQRRIEAGNAQAAAAVANVEDAKVQLTAEVANAYVNLREAQFRAKAYRTECELQQQTLSLTYQRYQQGVLPLFPLGNANAELELLKSQLAEAEADTAVLLDALAILAGQIPGTTDEALEAARFPKLSFMGILGLGGTSPDDLFDVSNPSILAIPQLQWNFLDFGRVDASVDQASAVRAEAVANYRKTVLSALQDAERALSRFSQQRSALVAFAQIKSQADGAADLDRQRFAGGVISRADLNRTLRKQQQAATDLVRGKAALTLSWIALQKSLGLGWQVQAKI